MFCRTMQSRYQALLQSLETISTQPTRVKVVGTFHVPSTQNPGIRLLANGTAERACYFCWLRHDGACLLLWLAAARRSVTAAFDGCVMVNCDVGGI